MSLMGPTPSASARRAGSPRHAAGTVAPVFVGPSAPRVDVARGLDELAVPVVAAEIPRTWAWSRRAVPGVSLVATPNRGGDVALVEGTRASSRRPNHPVKLAR